MANCRNVCKVGYIIEMKLIDFFKQLLQVAEIANDQIENNLLFYCNEELIY